MARISSFKGHEILIKLGDGEDPEVFTHPNLINSDRGLEFSTDMEGGELVDLADLTIPAVTTQFPKSHSLSVSGSGVTHSADVLEWAQWWKSGAAKNVKIYAGNCVVSTSMRLSSFKISGDRTAQATNEITLVSDGEITVAGV